MKSYIKEISNCCVTCHKVKDNFNSRYAFGESIYSDKPFEVISTDICGPIKSRHFSSSRNRDFFNILTVIDIYSRLTEFIIIWDIKASTIVQALKTKWIQKYETPKIMLSDKEGNILAKKWENSLKGTTSHKNLHHFIAHALKEFWSESAE